jgi:uncharacterized protein
MMDSVASLGFTRILTSPAVPNTDGESPLRRAILAGLLDAGVRGHRVASLWIRPEADSPLQILIAGPLTRVPPEGPTSRSRPLLFPLGATGTRVGPGELEKLLAPFSWWTGCAGSFEPLLRDTEEQAARAEERWSASPLDDVAGYLSDQAYAWLVVCAPVPEADVRGELEALRRRLFRLHQSGHRSETDTLDLERSQAWFRELSRAGTGGVWDVAIAAGTVDQAMALPVASIFCTAAERSVSLYKFRPSPDGPLPSADDAVRVSSCDSNISGGQVLFRATADLAAALVRPPEAELPGLRVVTPPSFDTTLETAGDPGDRVELGVVLDRFLRPAGPLIVGLGTLNRHTFVCGATGGGKSQTTRSLLEALSRRQPAVPWLVIEPAKAEYARMAGRLADLPGDGVLVIAPGDPDVPPASLNPLEPASLEPGNPDRTFPLQGHADLVRALFMAAFQADEPFPQVLSRALTECYQAAGWDLVTGEPLFAWDPGTGQPASAGTGRSLPRYPSLTELQLTAQRVVEAIGYGDDIKKNVRGFVDVRIGSLRLGTPGRFFEGGHPLDFAALLRRNVVVQAERITNDHDKAFVMGALLIRLYEQLLLEERERPAADAAASLRHVTVVEEAHRLLRNVPAGSPAAHSLELFASLLAEVRAYGEGIVIAEQIPVKLVPDVIKNTALKVVHRLPSADDRAAVGATMNLSEAQSQYVVTLTPGSAAVFTDGMDRPVLADMPLGEDREDTCSVTRSAPLSAGRRRSMACAEMCRHGEPCSLIAIRHAERLLGEHPELTFWMEISLAAHVVGFPAPGFADAPMIRALRQRGAGTPRLLGCAIAHAAEQGAYPRYDAMKEFFDPQALGAHLAAIVGTDLLGGQPGARCAEDRGRWRAGRLRFADIEASLRALAENKPTALGEEEIARRAGDRGLQLAGGTPGEQLGELRSLPSRHLGEDRHRALLLGDPAAPRILAAAAAITGPGEPGQQLRDASAQVLTWESSTQAERLVLLLHSVITRQ